VIRTLLPLSALLLALAVVPTADASGRRCGTKTLYGKALPLYAMGHGVRCADVERITGGACRLDPHKSWGCFSFRSTRPVLVWFTTKEMFADSWSRWIEARRPPCSQSRVSATGWRRARTDRRDTFPTEMQVLSDDLIRCRQLRGKRYAQVAQLLGKPDQTDRVKGARRAYWQVGPERDSFFQVDSESLTVRFDRHGRFRSATFTQG
jgi:hypothetical protein